MRLERARRLLLRLARIAAVCALTVVAVIAAGGGSAFWLCLPAALLLAAPASGAVEAFAGAALAVLAAAVPVLGSKSLGPAPSFPLAVLVPALSVAVLHAVRSRVEAEREALRTSALTDPLTGLPNRRALWERIDYEVSRHARQQRSFAVVMLDLDGFKDVNDRFGHPAGDELLRDVAEALRRAVRDQDTVARLGGDEFCILGPETDRAGGERLATRAEVAVGRVTAGLDTLSASVGVALFPDDASDVRAVVEAADAAQVAAKRRSRGRSRRAA